MFENFTRNLKRSRLSRKSPREGREVSFQNLETARACLVFGLERDLPVAMVETLRAMLSGKMKVDVLILKESKETSTGGAVSGATYAREEDISLSGKFLGARLQEMMRFPYDLLVDLSGAADRVGDYLLRSSRAKCKVGMERDGFQCDIVVEGARETGDFPARLRELLCQIKACDVS
jgi:hypothetical protein